MKDYICIYKNELVFIDIQLYLLYLFTIVINILLMFLNRNFCY